MNEILNEDDSISNDKKVIEDENLSQVSNLEDKAEIEEKENLTKKIEDLEKELNDYKDRFVRKAAEFENYKRRTENELSNFFKYAAEGFIKKILPIVDDFERSLKHLDDAKDLESFKQGYSLIYEKLMKILNEQGVTKIDAIGKLFDVHYHEALMQKKAEGVEPHTVLEELETGYLYQDKVIRHSKVIVSDDESNIISSELNIDTNGKGN